MNKSLMLIGGIVVCGVLAHAAWSQSVGGQADGGQAGTAGQTGAGSQAGTGGQAGAGGQVGAGGQSLPSQQSGASTMQNQPGPGQRGNTPEQGQPQAPGQQPAGNKRDQRPASDDAIDALGGAQARTPGQSGMDAAVRGQTFGQDPQQRSGAAVGTGRIENENMQAGRSAQTNFDADARASRVFRFSEQPTLGDNLRRLGFPLDDWRVVNHDGRFWFWTPNRTWMYYDNGDWRTFQPQLGLQTGISFQFPVGFPNDEWRVVNHGGRMWFWTPNQTWLYFDRGTWVPYRGGGAFGTNARYPVGYPADDWRLVFHNNRWWYWTPGQTWLLQDGDRWQLFRGDARAAGRFNDPQRQRVGFRGLESQTGAGNSFRSAQGQSVDAQPGGVGSIQPGQTMPQSGASGQRDVLAPGVGSIQPGQRPGAMAPGVGSIQPGQQPGAMAPGVGSIQPGQQPGAMAPGVGSIQPGQGPGAPLPQGVGSIQPGQAAPQQGAAAAGAGGQQGGLTPPAQPPTQPQQSSGTPPSATDRSA